MTSTMDYSQEIVCFIISKGNYTLENQPKLQSFQKKIWAQYMNINPKIKSKSLGKEILEEGCLSFPGQYLPIKRYKKVTVLAQDRKGEEIIIKADGILARAFQHEIDHLDGVLFIDRAGKKRKMVAFEDKK